jgi:hypothetical protein
MARLRIGQSKVFRQKNFLYTEKVYTYQGELYFGPLRFLTN